MDESIEFSIILGLDDGITEEERATLSVGGINQ